MKLSTANVLRPRALVAAVAFATTIGSTAVQAQGAGMGGMGGMGMGPTGHHATMGMGGKGGMGGDAGPMAGRMLDRMLDGVSATPEQRKQIRAIGEAAAADMKQHREAGAALREQSLKLFAQPDVDANAVEAQRQQMMQHHDQASRRMTQAMLDISRVLTPEQRAQWLERMQQRRQMMEQRRSSGGAPRT